MENQTLKMKDYKMTSLEQLEVGVLVVCLLLHFMSWNSMTVDGEKILVLAV